MIYRNMNREETQVCAVLDNELAFDNTPNVTALKWKAQLLPALRVEHPSTQVQTRSSSK